MKNKKVRANYSKVEKKSGFFFHSLSTLGRGPLTSVFETFFWNLQNHVFKVSVDRSMCRGFIYSSQKSIIFRTHGHTNTQVLNHRTNVRSASRKNTPAQCRGVSNKTPLPLTKTPGKTFVRWPEKMKPHSKLSKIQLRKK